MSGKRVVIIGAASGIGLEAARILAQLGARLVLVDVQPLDAVVKTLSAVTHVEALQGDMGAPEFIERFNVFGTIDALVLCAAAHYNEAWQGDARSHDRFHKIMDLNVRVPLDIGTAFVEKMADQGQGNIVLVGSVAGRSGGTSVNGPPDYAASKGALHVIVRWLSRRAVGRGVVVNAVAPGPVNTPMTSGMQFDASLLPKGRMAEPSEIAWPIAFLCSPAASYMSGAIVDVNGGTFVG